MLPQVLVVDEDDTGSNDARAFYKLLGESDPAAGAAKIGTGGAAAAAGAGEAAGGEAAAGAAPAGAEASGETVSGGTTKLYKLGVGVPQELSGPLSRWGTTLLVHLWIKHCVFSWWVVDVPIRAARWCPCFLVQLYVLPCSGALHVGSAGSSCVQ